MSAEDKDSIQALSNCVFNESDVCVRIEIVHALASQGNLVCSVLRNLAQRDPNEDVRNLARVNCQ